jgi:hypothetical protein
MPVRFEIDGLADVKAALERLPAELTDEAAAAIWAEADAAAEEIRAASPVRTTGLHPGIGRKSPWFAPGRLRGSVTVARSRGTFSVAAKVKNSDPIAWLYEHGSNARHWDGGKFVGAMPPHPVFGRAMSRGRRAMWTALRGILERHGLLVSEAA